jgi:hypothetical protein
MVNKTIYFEDGFFDRMTQAAKKAFPKDKVSDAIKKYITDRLDRAVKKDLQGKAA